MVYDITQTACSPMNMHNGNPVLSNELHNVSNYLYSRGAAFTRDLFKAEIQPSDLEKAVRDNEASFAYWPELNPLTALFWSKEREKEFREETMEVLRAMDRLNRDGDCAVVASLLGRKPSHVLANLIYGREKGLFVEYPQFNFGSGPTYAVKGSDCDKQCRMILERRELVEAK
jgi:hypothetical protein